MQNCIITKKLIVKSCNAVKNEQYSLLGKSLFAGYGSCFTSAEIRSRCQCNGRRKTRLQNGKLNLPLNKFQQLFLALKRRHCTCRIVIAYGTVWKHYQNVSGLKIHLSRVYVLRILSKRSLVPSRYCTMQFFQETQRQSTSSSNRGLNSTTTRYMTLASPVPWIWRFSRVIRRQWNCS